MMRRTLGLLVAALAAFAVAGPRDADAQATYPPERYQALAREILAELIEIDTTHRDGDNTTAAEAMARRLLDAGFPEEDVQVFVPIPRKGNLVARLRGRDTGRKPILLLAHIDVVAADPADWSPDVKPFTFMERDGYFYGRGVTDNKDEAAIHVANLIRMKEEGYVPDRDIIIALTADEEGGSSNGVRWLIQNQRDLIDAEFALNEGGGGTLKNGKRLYNAVQLSEKAYASFVFEATNPGGHSSLPREDNAIYELAEALTRVADFHFPVMLNEVTRAYFDATSKIEGDQIGADMQAMLRDQEDMDAIGRLARTPAYNSRMRTTCVATRLSGGHADNALPQRARATVNCRMLPDHDPADVLANLRRLAGDEVTVTGSSRARPNPASPLTPAVMDPIRRVTEEMWPGVPTVPIMLTGATDGRSLRNAGIPVYGVSGLFNDIDDVRAHGRDERILTRSFFEGQEFLYRLTKALSRTIS